MNAKEENVEDEVDPAASSTLGAEGSTKMKRLLEAMAPICRVYDIDFGKLVEEHELGTREGINGKMEFMFVDTAYNVRRDGNADNSEYDILTSEDMRHMGRVLGNVMKPGAHGHTSAYHLSSSFGTKLRYLNLRASERVLLQIMKILDLKARKTKLLRSSHRLR